MKSKLEEKNEYVVKDNNWKSTKNKWKYHAIIAGIIYIFIALNNKQVDLLGFYIGIALQIVYGIACGTIVYTNAFFVENNKVNFIGLGFFCMSLLQVAYIYFFSAESFISDISKHYYLDQILMSTIGGLWVYIGLYGINTKMKMKRCYIVSIIGIIVIMLGLFRGHHMIEQIVYDVGFTKIKIYISVFNLLLWLWLWIQSVKICSPFNQVVAYYIRCLSITQCLYALVGLVQSHLLCDNVMLINVCYIRCLGPIIKCHIYFLMYRFVYEHSMHYIWLNKNIKVAQNKQRLKDDQAEKYLFGMASRILEKNVNDTYQLAMNMYHKIAVSKYSHQVKYVHKIINNCRRLIKLNANIRDLNDIENGKQNITFEVTDIVKLIENIVESTNPYIEAMHMKISIINKQECIYCRINIESIERVILNLISNAIKYGSDKEEMEIYINLRNEKVYICVRDHGRGMPKDKISAVFNRFERLDNTLARSREGSGLGLAIVRSIVQMHQGDINIISEQDEGTRVCISFPVCERDNVKENIDEVKRQEKLENKIQVELSDLNV